MFFFHRRGVGGGGKIWMKNSITFNVFFIKIFPNKAIINYNNLEGWLNYRKLSDKYAQEIKETIKKIKNKNDRQSTF